MTLYDAQVLALQLMKRYSLWNWSFNWHNRKRAFGSCSHAKQTIFLSRVLVPKMDIDAVKNTILHEIAHALVGVREGHNNVWKRKAIEIGCDGNRTSNYDIDVQTKYVAICNGCGKKIGAHRRPKRQHWCKCDMKRFSPDMVLNYVQQF